MTRIRSRFTNFTVPSREIRGTEAAGSTPCANPALDAGVLWDKWKYSWDDSSVTVRREATMVDELLPEYHTRRKSGEILPTNEMTYTEVDIPERTIYSGIRYVRGHLRECKGFNTRPGDQRWNFESKVVKAEVSTPPALMPAAKYSSLLNACRVEAKAKLHSQGMDWLTSGVEAHKSIAMLLGVKRKFQDSFLKTAKFVIRDIKQRKLRVQTVSDVWDLFQGYWLEGRFGWRILYYDLLSLTNYLESRNDSSRLIVGRASAEISDVLHGSGRSVNTETTRKVKITVGYPAMLDPSILGYANPINTAWDIIPFSLVVDWFLDVQSFILAHSSAPSNVKPLPHASFEVIESESIQTTKVSLNGIENIIGESGEPEPVSLRNYRKVRTVAQDPKIAFPPLVGGPQGYQRLDLVALLRPMLGYLS